MTNQITVDKMAVNKTVYYFSGTGNSYFVAKRIAKGINGSLKSLLALDGDCGIFADIVCFVFPSYDFKPPRKVIEIISKLESFQAKHVIAISTYGIALAKTLVHFERVLKEKKIVLTSGYGIKMPHNAVGSIIFTDDDNQIILDKAERRVKSIIANINSKNFGVIEKTTVFEGMTILKQLPKVLKLVFILIFKGAKALEFSVTENCNSCFQCQKICPVNNIVILEGKPTFKDRCTSCFACLQWCPKRAIHIGKYSFKAMALRSYHHPLVSAKVLIEQGLLE